MVCYNGHNLADGEVDKPWCLEPDCESDPDTCRHRQLLFPIGKHVDQILIDWVSMLAK